MRRAAGRREVVIPGDPSLVELLDGYVKYAKRTLRSPDTAIRHANRIGPWAEKYRASDALLCAEAAINDMTGHYAPATINRSLGALKKALTLAWRGKIIPENYGARIARLPENNERHSYPAIEVVRAIVDHCSESAKAAIWMALLTGARRGEICMIDPKLHVHGDRLDIPASHTKMLRIKSLPILPPMREWLEHFPLKITVSGVKSAFRRARIVGFSTIHVFDQVAVIGRILICRDFPAAIGVVLAAGHGLGV